MNKLFSKINIESVTLHWETEMFSKLRRGNCYMSLCAHYLWTTLSSDCIFHSKMSNLIETRHGWDEPAAFEYYQDKAFQEELDNLSNERTIIPTITWSSGWIKQAKASLDKETQREFLRQYHGCPSFPDDSSNLYRPERDDEIYETLTRPVKRGYLKKGIDYER